jgi:hypothetical protein
MKFLYLAKKFVHVSWHHFVVEGAGHHLDRGTGHRSVHQREQHFHLDLRFFFF